MKNYKKAFTLMEMLFVVIIAAWALAFSAYKLKGMKEKGIEYGATGFLMDIAGAKAAMKQDLAMQGMDLDQYMRSSSCGLTENIEVNPSGLANATTSLGVNDTRGKLLSKFLTDNISDCRGAFVTALFAYGYLKQDIPTVGDYRYYISFGFPITNTCGALPLGQDAKVVSYMCKPAARGSHGANWSTENDTRCKINKGYAYMEGGTVLPRDYAAKPPIVGPNNCRGIGTNSANPDVSGFSCTQIKRDSPLSGTSTGSSGHILACDELPGWNPDYSILQKDVTGNCAGYEGTSSFNCTTTCQVDITKYNNETSDAAGKNTSVDVCLDEDYKPGDLCNNVQSMTCYDYWHNAGAREGY